MELHKTVLSRGTPQLETNARAVILRRNVTVSNAMMNSDIKIIRYKMQRRVLNKKNLCCTVLSKF